MTNIMTLHGPDGNDILAERTNLMNHPIENDRYIYMLCACPVPLNIVWRFEIPKHTGYYYSICPDCKEFIGVEALGKDGRMTVKKDRYLSENFKESIIKKCESDQKAKSDDGKPKLSIVPMKIIFAIEKIRKYGNNKYPEGGSDNWKTVEPERHYEASLRHTAKHWNDPFAIDPESGLPHYFHKVCDDAFFIEQNWDKFMEAIEKYKEK